MANPSQYTPVPTGGSQLTALNTQTTGSLDCCVQQPVEFTLNSDDPRLVERWKCPTSQLLKLDSHGGYKVYGEDFTIGQERPNLEANAKFVSRFEEPAPPVSCEWFIDQIDVRQYEAGDHSEFTVNYVPRYKGDETSGWIVSDDYLVEGDHWDLEWRAVNQSVLAYCRNPKDAVPKWERFIPNANQDVLKPEGQPVEKATAQFIKECAGRSNFNTKWGQLGVYEWVRNCSVYSLNDSEKKIFQYYINNINPIVHVPVLTHTVTTKYPKLNKRWRTINGKVLHIPYTSDDGKIAAQIDQVVQTSYFEKLGCPYDIEDSEGSKFEWLVTGDKMTEINREGYTVYQRVMEYTGARKWCGHFYKGGSWTINGETAPKTPWTIGEM